MRTCILHFGLLKTGTTSIQQALFRQPEDSQFTHVHLGTPAISRNLITGFCRPPWRFAPDLLGTKPKLSKEARDTLRASLTYAKVAPVIISAEALSLFTHRELEDFVDFLRQLNLDVEAVAYVRDYHSWCESLFQQSVKYGTWHNGLFPLGSNAYRFCIEKFDKVLGKERVRLWKYDRSRFPEGCVVRDFFQRLRLGVNPEIRTEFNRGLGLEAAKLLLAYHQSDLGAVCDWPSFRQNMALADHVSGMADTPVRFHTDLIAQRAAEEAADLEWIEDRLGASVRAIRPLPDGERAIRSESNLQEFSREALAWLASESGRAIAAEDIPQKKTQWVANAMVALRDKVGVRPSSPGWYGPTEHVPKIIWLYWDKGFENAPPLVGACVESWRQLNPGWDIRLLDEMTAEPYLRRARVPWSRLKGLPTEKQANILRMRLLTEHGGVWTDAATLCLQPLDDWLPQCMDGGLFVFRDAAPFLMVTNWFIASHQHGRLATLWRDAHEQYWAQRDLLHHSSYPGQPTPELPRLQRMLLRLFHRAFDRTSRSTDWWFHPVVTAVLRTYPYCVMHYIFAREYHRNAEWKSLADRMAYRDAKLSTDHYMDGGDGKTLEELTKAGAVKNATVLKLKWDKPPLTAMSPINRPLDAWLK